MQKFFMLASLLVAFVPLSAWADITCMERFGDSWVPYFPNGNEITGTRCAPNLAYDYDPPVRFRLTQGPIRSPGKVTCRWTSVPPPGDVLPQAGVPDSIICTLFTMPPAEQPGPSLSFF